MGKARFSLIDRTLNLDQIEGRYNSFVKAYYAIPVRMSKPLAEDGHGIASVDGIEISKGQPFHMDVIVSMDVLMLSVGEVATEYDREYTLTLTGYTAKDGTPFKDATLKFKTLPRTNLHDPKYAAHEEVALQAAREGMVLLKNENHVLPLAPDAKFNVFGMGQFMFRNSATGAGLINPRWQANFHQSIAEHSGFTINPQISSLYRKLQDAMPSSKHLDAAREYADIGIVLLSRTSGEFLDNKPDKGGYYLTDGEKAMVETVSNSFSKTVAIINSSYPIDLRWVDRLQYDSVIYTGFCGMGAGYALMELLDGRANFSGKLPDTWAYDYYDHPSAHNFINFKAEDTLPGEKDYGVELYYEEDIYVGYRYFDTFSKPVQYPFGHGLSYTSFAFEEEACHWNGKTLSAQMVIRNTGTHSGKEVASIYIVAPDGRIEKPSRVLAGFEKTNELAPGEAQAVTISCPAMNFASFDETRHAFVLEAGTYRVLRGEAVIGEFAVEEEQILRTVKPVNAPVEEFHRMTQADPTVRESSHTVPLDQRIVHKAQRPEWQPTPLPKYTGKKITFADLKQNPKLLNAFVAQMTDAELCRLNVGGGANWYMPWQDGSACKSRRVSRLKTPVLRVSDGNTGLNLKKSNIGFPSSAAVAASFNKDLAYQIGRVIGEESRENGIAVNLGPAANLHRNILNGRQPEYFSEDPVLAGTLAALHAKGLEDSGTGATYKHLFCNNSDTCRKASHSIVSERALRELYYKVFDVALSIYSPSCVMTSYNAVNGIYPAENPDVLQKLLRQEWGFTGFIMTDWGTYDTVASVEMAKAGNCWLTEGSGKQIKALKAALDAGELQRSHLEDNVKHLVQLLLKYC